MAFSFCSRYKVLGARTWEVCLLFLLGACQGAGKWLLRAPMGGRKAETCCSKALSLAMAGAAALGPPPSYGSSPEHWEGVGKCWGDPRSIVEMG